MHQNEWFQVWFFKNFLGRGSPSPLPRPLPPLFLGLRPRFGLRPQFSGASRPRLGLRPRYSGASRPRFGLRPQLSIGDLDLAPPKINSWIRPWPTAMLNNSREGHKQITGKQNNLKERKTCKNSFNNADRMQIEENYLTNYLMNQFDSTI